MVNVIKFLRKFKKSQRYSLKAGLKIKETLESHEIINWSTEDKDSNSKDFVTVVDKGVEKYIFYSLKELFPSFELIGEGKVSASESK